MMAMAMPVMAATTFSLSPAGIHATRDQNFSVTVLINPQGIKNYTGKVELRYPADLVEVKSFTFGDGWMWLPQPGYDTVDNASGILVKTAGYPGGISSTAVFGTAAFSVKKAGSGIIKVGDNSLVLDAANQNVLSKTSVETSVTIAGSTPAPALTTPAQAPAPAPPIAEQPPVQPAPQPTGQFSLLAAIGTALTIGSGSIWVGILMGIIILAVLIYLIYYFIQRSRRKNISRG